jgi:hypothetical protein
MRHRCSQYGKFTGAGPLEATDHEKGALRETASPPKQTGFSAAHRAARVDPRAMLSFDSNVDYRPSLRVVRRFCGIVLFFACWATVRHWPYPINYLSNMLKVAFVVCIAFALLRNERFADVNLNYWDEGLAYVAIALFLDFFGAR